MFLMSSQIDPGGAGGGDTVGENRLVPKTQSRKFISCDINFISNLVSVVCTGATATEQLGFSWKEM